MEYTYLYKQEYKSLAEFESLKCYDYYVTMYTQSERVMQPADRIHAKEKIWVVDKAEAVDFFLKGKEILLVDTNEDWMTINNFVKSINPQDKRICIDSTGFTIPYLLFFLRALYICGVRKVDILYSEPKKYEKEEKTSFSEDLLEVKQLYGLSGIHTSETENDYMIIAAGYDHSRIIDVANKKKLVQKVLLFGFPSMSAEMFQENVIRAYRASDSVGSYCFQNMENNIYAPANDPFVTAQAIKEYIESHKHDELTNIYLAPLSSKPQALGMALFYINEHCWEKGISILYPFSNKYHRRNTIGIARTWLYEFEFE